MGDLAPRDVVAAAIDARLRATGDACVYLDARGIEGFEARFPTVTAACRAAGIDPVRQPIPVVPGAHYSCGGVVTDVYGQTELPGLFAAGEVARTGMHGANRLGVQQLAGRLGRRWPRRESRGRACAGGRADARADARPSRSPTPRPKRGELQSAMSRDASVVRDAAGLQRLSDTLSRGAGSHRDAPSRFRGRGAGADRPRGGGRGAGPQRKPGLSPPRGVPGHRAGTGAAASWSGWPTTSGARRGAGGGVLMTLSDGELAAALDVIRRGLDEDLRYGPDITTLATVPAGASPRPRWCRGSPA